MKTDEKTRMSVKFEVVTLADPIDKLVEYDRNRSVKVRFDPKPGSFLELDQAQLNRLGSETQMAYSIARDENFELSKETDVSAKETEVLARIKKGADVSSATKRLEIRHKLNGFVYRWIRPDMVDEWLDMRGYVVVQDGPERTMANSTGEGPHVISRDGKPELTLVRRSIELADAAKIAQKERRKRLKMELEDKGKAGIEQAGFKLVDDGTPGDFKPIRSQE